MSASNSKTLTRTEIAGDTVSFDQNDKNSHSCYEAVARFTPSTVALRIRFSEQAVNLDSISERLKFTNSRIDHTAPGPEFDIFASGKTSVLITLKALFAETEIGSGKPIVSQEMQDALVDEYSDFMMRATDVVPVNEL